MSARQSVIPQLRITNRERSLQFYAGGLAEFGARAVAPTEAPHDTPWGAREMLLTDPDGNRLRFALHGT